MDYVLVIKRNNNFKIGINRYSKSEALNRLKTMKAVGHKNVIVMTYNEAIGLHLI